MTGTSLDGIDVAVINMGSSGDIHLLGSQSFPLDRELAKKLMSLQTPSHDELHESAVAAIQYADAVSAAIHSTLQALGLQAENLQAVGVHGQTLRHRPELGYSIQLNAPARIAESTNITVVSDFRSRDLAAAGQGAPLVPAFHRQIFASETPVQAVVNIGGIANISWLGQNTLGYDCGPGNMLMDLWVHQHQGTDFDRNGDWGQQGQVQDRLLEEMLKDPFFHQPAPKSTGRDLFSSRWLESILEKSESLKAAPVDVQATLRRLTAQSIAQELQALESSTQETLRHVWVCGGGAQNQALMNELRQQLMNRFGRAVPVDTTHLLGWDPQVIEASAFAWLAAQAMRGLPGNLPAVTGASGERVLGSITPAARPPTPASV
jgi:anhydro-N-acetylmuramic acid kinase